MTLVWMEAAVSVNQLPGSANLVRSTRRCRDGLRVQPVQECLSRPQHQPLDALKSTPKKSPASSRSQYGFT